MANETPLPRGQIVSAPGSPQAVIANRLRAEHLEFEGDYPDLLAKEIVETLAAAGFSFVRFPADGIGGDRSYFQSLADGSVVMKYDKGPSFNNLKIR